MSVSSVLLCELQCFRDENKRTVRWESSLGRLKGAYSDADKQKEAVLPARTDSPDLNLNMRGKTEQK